ncbi:Uncharacterised protein [Mycobacteroides abscessus subsp. abscessus]|nr:Uncharacterised protein [Mycobacteroides abscessus subsp. abscessus]SKU50763.1 Uncharacterised protein [Mycobacteroides abscessus subsp. abscessus]
MCMTPMITPLAVRAITRRPSGTVSGRMVSE